MRRTSVRQADGSRKAWRKARRRRRRQMVTFPGAREWNTVGVPSRPTRARRETAPENGNTPPAAARRLCKRAGGWKRARSAGPPTIPWHCQTDTWRSAPWSQRRRRPSCARPPSWSAGSRTRLYSWSRERCPLDERASGSLPRCRAIHALSLSLLFLSFLLSCLPSLLTRSLRPSPRAGRQHGRAADPTLTLDTRISPGRRGRGRRRRNAAAGRGNKPHTDGPRRDVTRVPTCDRVRRSFLNGAVSGSRGGSVATRSLPPTHRARGRVPPSFRRPSDRFAPRILVRLIDRRTRRVDERARRAAERPKERATRGGTIPIATGTARAEARG